MDGLPLPVEVDNRNPHAVALGSLVVEIKVELAGLMRRKIA